MKIEIKHLRKEYKDGGVVLKDVNAVINEGDVIAVIGPSGCGKSTFIRCINMISPPSSGEILVDGQDITDRNCNLSKIRQRIGMVFQSYNLFEHLTVVENVMLALTDIKHLTKQEAYDIAVRELTKVGLSEKLMNYPETLSGGQKQRASIARTLALDPDMILLDEPTSALDPTMVREVENVIKNLAKSGKTMMIVTHEMRLAKAISNRVFYMDNGELYEEGTPDEIFESPKRERTKAFMNHLKVFKYKFNAGDFDYSEYVSKLDSFAANNLIPMENLSKVNGALSRFVREVLPECAVDNSLCDIIVEYGEENGETKVLIYLSAPESKKEDIKKNAEAILGSDFEKTSVEEIADEDYNLKATCNL